MVDDEEVLVWSTARQMARDKPELAFEGLTDPLAALERIKRNPPDLLITDVRMPGMSGLELLLAARAVSPRLPVVVITAYGTAELRAQVRARASVEYLEKPFSFPALSAAVERGLATVTGFSGAVVLQMLPDIIQMYALSRVTGALRISRGAAEGGIWFDSGEIVHATCEELTGPAAVYRLLTWDGGSFGLEAGATVPERTVKESWQELLIEGCRLLDESRQGSADGLDQPFPQAEDSVSIVETGDSRPELEGAEAPAWARLRPVIEETSPKALVLAARPGGLRAWVLRGTLEDASPWGRALGGLVDRVRVLSRDAPSGVFECTGGTAGIALFWSVPRQIVLAIVAPVEGPIGINRFRSSVARWWQVCESEMSGSPGQPE
jgi:CheY-like chemotaxis protein